MNKRFEKHLVRAIGKKRVLNKPNDVSIDTPRCAIHVDAIEGILDRNLNEQRVWMRPARA